MSPQDSLNAQNFVPLFNSSQVWKDLQRDVIVVNGERISGEMGAEAMIGALVRHISDKAEHIRILQQKTQLSHMGIDRNGSEKLVQSNFEISESLIVECARDLIVLCNRTQSGGDTYFCVEALLCGERTDSKTILTPLSAEADPLSFSIDVVLISNVVAPCSDVGAPMHLHRSEPLEHASPRDPDLGNSKYMESKSAGVPKDSKGDDKKAHRVHSLGPGAFDVDHSPSTQRSSANLQKKMLHSSNAAKERRRSHLSSKPLGGSAIPCSEGNEADVSDSCKPSENGKDRQSKEQEKDKPKIGLTTRRFSNSSLVDSNVSETSETEGKARSITPKRRRKPQLDLRGELDLEGFHFNYLASSSPMRKSSPLTDVHVLEDVDLTSPFAASVGEPPETVDTQLYDSGRHEQFLSEIPIVVGQKDEEFSVISELTYDTFSRSAMNNNGRAKMPLNQNGEPTIRQTPAGFRENPSILKQLGKSLKPFKLPTVSESFEGISSPFRNMRRRGSNTNRYAESPSVPSGAQSSATGPQKAGRSSSHDRTPNMATRERNCSEANATCSSDILDSTSQCSNGSLHTICIRVKVQAVSRYKVCSSNPSGIESADTWASVRGIFTQTFLIGANGGQHLGMADRLVSIDIEECNTPHEVLGQP